MRAAIADLDDVAVINENGIFQKSLAQKISFTKKHIAPEYYLAFQRDLGVILTVDQDFPGFSDLWKDGREITTMDPSNIDLRASDCYSLGKIFEVTKKVLSKDD